MLCTDTVDYLVPLHVLVLIENLVLPPLLLLRLLTHVSCPIETNGMEDSCKENS